MNRITEKEEFLQTLTDQIRFVKAREGVARELADHIEDLAAALEEKGLEPADAVREAVSRMGDPVEIGMQLDLIHRPQTNWRLILLIVLCTIGGLAVQYATGMFAENTAAFGKQILFDLLGFAVMLGIYFLDYGFLGTRAREIFVGMSLAAVLGIVFLVPEVNGMHRAGILPMYLFVPAFAGILYRYRGSGVMGVVRAVLWLILPVVISHNCIPSLPTAANLFLICGVMTLTAVAKGWFLVDRRKMILLLLGVGVVLPVLFCVIGYFFLFADYQKARLLAYLNPAADPFGRGYVASQIRLMLHEIPGLFSGIPEKGEFLSSLVAIDRGYGLIHLILTYGLIFGLAVIIAFVKLVQMAFGAAFRQKNQLGFMIGFGCGMVFLVMCLEGVAVNFTLLPATTIVLPFLSTGGTAVIVYSVLLGLLLCVHRYQNV